MKTLLIGINSKYIHPAMGIYQIYANSKFSVSYCEFTVKDKIQSIIDFINKENYDLLGFSVYIWNTEIIEKIIGSLSEKYLIILGGPEASYRYQDFFTFNNVRYIIKGEGEEAFNKLIDMLVNNKSITTVPNLYYRTKTGFKYTFSKAPVINKIRHDLTLIKDFKNRYAYLESSRGCCFNCSYCLASLERTIRYFPIDKVIAEINYLLNQKTKTIKFLDRSFNINQNRMREILRYIIENDNQYTVYQFEIVGDYFEKETIALIKTIRKGLIRFEIGIQSTNPTVNKAINRQQNFEEIKKNIALIKNNIVIHVDLIAGLPYENHQSFIKTFNDTYLLDVEEIQLGFLKELKGTKISATKAAHEYLFNDKPPYQVIKNKYITGNELTELSDVEAVLNKYHNTGNFRRTLSYLFKEKQLNPYYTFLKISQYIAGTKINSYQHWQIAQILYLSLKKEIKEEQRLLFLIKQDYLLKDNIRPKIWWDPIISKKEKANLFLLFIDKYPELNLNILYRYSQLERYHNQYFLITYKPKKHYFLNLKQSD